MLLGGFVTWWFVFVATFFAKFTHFGHIVKGFMFALVIDSVMPDGREQQETNSKWIKWCAHAVLGVFILWWWLPPDEVQITSVPASLPYVTLASVFISLIYEATSIQEYEHALRTLAFKGGVGVVLVVFAHVVTELSSVLQTMTLEQTTRSVNATTCGESTEGIIFDVNTNYSKCPDKLWQLLRINLLFGTQLYTLYILSTAVHINLKEEHEHPFVVGTAAVTECVALTAAIAGQFDVIHNCHIITWTTFSLILISLISKKVRVLQAFWYADDRVADFTFSNYISYMNKNDVVKVPTELRPFFPRTFLRYSWPSTKLKL